MFLVYRNRKTIRACCSSRAAIAPRRCGARRIKIYHIIMANKVPRYTKGTIVGRRVIICEQRMGNGGAGPRSGNNRRVRWWRGSSVRCYKTELGLREMLMWIFSLSFFWPACCICDAITVCWCNDNFHIVIIGNIFYYYYFIKL